MTNEEQELLISYLVDAGDIDPEGDVEAQFLDWYRNREGVVPGETPLQGHPNGRGKAMTPGRVPKSALRGKSNQQITPSPA